MRSRALEYLPGQDSSWRNAATHILGDGYDFSGEMVEAYRSRLEAVEASRASRQQYCYDDSQSETGGHSEATRSIAAGN